MKGLFELKNRFYIFLKVGLPFGIWCFLFKSLLLGQTVINSETFYIYSIIKFYIDNLKIGIFPLWDPFVMWGTPTQIFFNYVGIYNPFWFLIPILNTCGLSFYQSFICTITLYFWIGQWGFYLLANILLKDKRAAYFAFLLFLFSSLSMSLFAQYHLPLIYVPSIWFFFFLFSFFQNPQRSTWIGLIFATGIILTSYLPFYFLTVFIIIILLTGFLYYPMIKENLLGLSKFLRVHAGLMVFSFGVLILAFAPGFQAYQSTVAKEVVAPFRNEIIEKKAGVDFSNYSQIAVNALTARMDFQDLYSNLDVIQYGDDCFFYISMFFYIVLMAGAFVCINKRMIICALTALTLFFLMITSASGFHRFLFEHVFYFKLIRNMHFFLPYFLAAMVLLAAEQFRLIFNNREIFCAKHRWLILIAIVLSHSGFWIFLRSQEYIIFSSYLTLGFSFLFWICFILPYRQAGLPAQRISAYALPIFLFLSIVVQPVEVLWRHNQSALTTFFYRNKEIIQRSTKTPSVKPIFSYIRLVSSMEIDNDDIANSRITMRDASRFFSTGFPVYWSFYLMQKVPFEVLQKYTAYKFYLYDSLKILKNNGDLESLTSVLREGSNMAFVFSEHDTKELSELMQKTRQEIPKMASVIAGPSEQFKVTYFDVNSIKIQTQYMDEKFLVYTDSYQKHWKAFINGKSAAIYRTNMAFKGIRLPSGYNEVYLRYMPQGVSEISLLLLFTMMSMFIFLVWMSVQDYVKNKT